MAWGTYHFCNWQTAGFSITKIRSNFVAEPRWETPPLKEREMKNVKEILSQSYSYLGKGAQCYVFVSQDGGYVLKFLRISHLDAPAWLKRMPLPNFLEGWRNAKIALRKSKKEKDFASYLFAYEELQEETGLLFLHLNKSSDLKQEIQLIDKTGIAHTLDLDQMEFILQKRAKPFYEAISEMIEDKKIENAETAIRGLLELLFTRRSHGLSDKDPDLETNFGLIGSRPVQFDIGRFKKGELAKKNEPFRNEVIRITDRFKHWLQNKEPALANYLDEQINAY
ncbi:MAG: hypothetical protein ACHQT8_03885 [Chlamydiales bacterium]